MKIGFVQNYKEKNVENVSFEAGLTSKMMQEIQQADVLAISKRLAKKGIPNDFAGNKVISWCCDKSIQIVETINKKYHAHFALPKGIYVKDFNRLNIDEDNAIGFCNLGRTELYKGSSEEIPEGVIFFDTFEDKITKAPKNKKWLYDWNNINEIADYMNKSGQSETDFFLDVFMHELSHNIHLDRVSKKISGKSFAQYIDLFKNADWLSNYQSKYGSKLAKLCNYTQKSPLEAVACDMSKVISDSLDKETLIPTQNPFVGTPYEKLSLLERIDIPNYSDESRPLNEILRNFWNGKFD